MLFNNLSVEQRLALRSLSEDQSITIKPADKGGALVIMATADYVSNTIPPMKSPTTTSGCHKPCPTSSNPNTDTAADLFRKRKKDSKSIVYNLSKRTLSTAELSVLELGLTFSPSKKAINKDQIAADVFQFKKTQAHSSSLISQIVHQYRKILSVIQANGCNGTLLGTPIRYVTTDPKD